MTCPECGSEKLGPHKAWSGGGFVDATLCGDCGAVQVEAAPEAEAESEEETEPEEEATTPRRRARGG